MSAESYLKKLFGLSGSTAIVIGGTGVLGGAIAEALAQAGAHTIAQDERTSVVYGMPRAAVMRGAAGSVLPLEHIGEHVAALAGHTVPALAKN